MRFFAVLIVAISTLFVVKRLSSEKGSPVGATTYKKHSDARKDRKVSVGSRMKVSEKDLTRLSTFASKTPAVAGVLLIGLHYTVDFAASAASHEIFGGGWAGNASPSRSSRIARSGFGST